MAKAELVLTDKTTGKTITLTTEQQLLVDRIVHLPKTGVQLLSKEEIETLIANAKRSVTFNVAATEGTFRNVNGVISVYASGAWRQIFPAVYSS